MLTHWSNSPLVNRHSDTLFWFRANQSLLVLLHTGCVLGREVTHTNCIVLGLTRSWFEPTIYCTRGEQTSHYTTNVVLKYVFEKALDTNRHKRFILRFNFYPLTRMSKGKVLLSSSLSIEIFWRFLINWFSFINYMHGLTAVMQSIAKQQIRYILFGC